MVHHSLKTKGDLLDLSGTREKSDSHRQGPELNWKTWGSRWECWATKHRWKSKSQEVQPWGKGKNQARRDLTYIEPENLITSPIQKSVFSAYLLYSDCFVLSPCSWCLQSLRLEAWSHWWVFKETEESLGLHNSWWQVPFSFRIPGRLG